MTYCLMTEDKKIRVEIRCLASERPSTLSQLYILVNNNQDALIKPRKLNEAWASKSLGKQELVTDWERTGTGGRFINWVPTENL